MMTLFRGGHQRLAPGCRAAASSSASRHVCASVVAWKQDEQQQPASAAPGTSRRQAAQDGGSHRVLKASLDTMLQHYYAKTPSASRVIDKVYRDGYGLDQVVHDHLAFRSFGVPGFGIEALGSALEALGYTQRDFYQFPNTHLLAAWYAPPPELYTMLPRMFVSQLQIHKLSPTAQGIIRSYTDSGLATAAPASAGSHSHSHASSSGGGGGASSSSSSSTADMLSAWTAAVTHTLPWRAPSREDYQALLSETEYGAWVLVNGWALNHTALSVHSIAGRSGDIHSFADELVAQGFAMNEAGGVMKVSPDSGLLQCSTVADLVGFPFADGQVHPVVGSYMEFVERKVLPQHAHLGQAVREAHRRDGFEADSASDIFKSTSLAAAAAQQQGVL